MNVRNNKSLAIFPIFLVAYELIAYLSNDMYLPAMPHMMHDLGTADHYAQLTLTSWFMGSALMQLPIGPLADHFGRRLVLLFGGVVFIASTLSCGFATNIAMLLGSRFLQGAAVSTIAVAGYGIIHENFEQKQAIVLLAWMNSITVLAPTLGPLGGAAVLTFMTWRYIFLLLGMLSVVTVAALYRYTPSEESSHHRGEEFNFMQVLRDYKMILTTPVYMAHVLTCMFVFSGLIAWLAAGPFIIINAFKLSTWYYGLFQILVCGSFVAGTRAVKPLVNRYQPVSLIMLGLGITFVGGTAATVMGYFFPQFLSGLIISMMLYEFGVGLALAPLNRCTVEASTAPMGLRLAGFGGFIFISGILGSALVSLTYDGKILDLATILLGVSCMGFITQIFRHYKLTTSVTA